MGQLFGNGDPQFLAFDGVIIADTDQGLYYTATDHNGHTADSVCKMRQ